MNAKKNPIYNNETTEKTVKKIANHTHTKKGATVIVL